MPIPGGIALAALLLLLPTVAVAQPAAPSLSVALARLNANPRDVDALIAAGNAALAMGDTDAAVGFFTRADRIAPGNARIEAGLAGAKVRAEDPYAAIPLFDAAERSGPIPTELLADRGLAYDLVGDNARAQRTYNQALTLGVNSAVSRRLALSLAISGDRRASEAVLAPLLQKQDRAAWRTRIFALAILGYEDEAIATARATMPPDMALAITPYLRYMRQLTPAQQAAAANLGHFPRASEIGHDDPRVAQFAPQAGARLAVADRLVPQGAPLGPVAGQGASAPSRRRKDREHGFEQSLVATAKSVAPAPPALSVSRVIRPAVQVGVSAMSAAAVPVAAAANFAPPPASSSPMTPAPPVVASTPRLAAEVPVRSVATSRPVTAASPQASVAVAPATVSAPAMPPMIVASVPQAVSRPRPAPAPRPSFAEAFAEMTAPAVVDTAPERGAVDLRRITPARAIPKAPPPPPPPAHPSRIWVELGVGRDYDRLGFDWRRMVKDDPELFRGRKPFVTGWVRTNRLLVGPFESDRAAESFMDKLRKADHPTAFVWTSPAGQVVDPLGRD